MRTRYAYGAPAGRRLPVAVAIVLLAVACQPSGSKTTTSTIETIAPPATSTTTAATSTTTAAPPDSPDQATPDPGRILRMGLERDMSTDNYWAHRCRDAIDINSAVLDSTRPSLYELAMPGINIVPDLAVSPQPPQPQPEGDVWTVDVAIRDDAVWSDGEPITADDVVFTVDLVADIGLLCLADYGIAGVDSAQTGVLGVEATAGHTVRITFSAEPGLGVWPHTIGIAPIMAEHFWAPHVADARSAGEAAVDAITDPAATVWEAERQAAEAAGEEFTKTIEEISTEEADRYLAGAYHTAMTEALFAVSGVGDPSGGPMIYAGRTPGLEMRNVANPRYFRSGEMIESGGATYEMGPFVDEQVFLIYDSTESLIEALADREIDYAWVGSSAPALVTMLDTSHETTFLENPNNAFWYLGFNLRKPPMNDLAFRRAVAMMIDREFLSEEVFQGVLPPAWTLLPEANLRYYDPEAAAAIASKYHNLTPFQRLEAAVAILQEGGYTWEREPSIGRDEGGDPIIEPGRGIAMPDGTPAPALEILSPAPGTGVVFFAAYGAYIERWLDDLGFDARNNISTFGGIWSKVWPGAGLGPTFDLYLSGWILGNTAFPNFHDSFFHSRNLAEVNNGNNSAGYVNPEFDALAEQIYQVRTEEDAKAVIWQLEAILDRDLPCVVLTGISATDIVSSRLDLPFTEALGGLTNLTDFAGLVRIRE